MDEEIPTVGEELALVCLEHREQGDEIAKVLRGMKYRVHLGLSVEDAIMKLKSHPYRVVLISILFGGGDPEENPLVHYALFQGIETRREQFLIFVGPHMETNHSLQAFACSADLVINGEDLDSLVPLLRNGVAEQNARYERFRHCQHSYDFA